MKTFKDILKNTSISASRIIVLLITLTFCYLSAVGKITASEFIPTFCIIIGYYFGKSTVFDNYCKSKEDN